MTKKTSFVAALVAAGAALLPLATPAIAGGPSPKKMMEMSASCAYVVAIAEGNNVSLNYPSSDWLSVVQILQDRTGLDGEKAIETAKAKYKKRARVMGADEAFQYMIKRAQDCDREMAVIQS